MIHHVIHEVSDLERSGNFYDSLLAPLGWRRHFDRDGIVGWGIAKPAFFISDGNDSPSSSGLVSFSSPGIAGVKAAYEAAVASGGSGVVAPGAISRPGAGSYSCVVDDPDGHRIEVTVGSD